MFLAIVANLFAVLIGTILAGIFLLWHKPHLDVDGNTIITLKKSPNQINQFDIAHLVALIALKHALPAFTGYRPPLLPEPGSAQAFRLPCVRLEGPLSLTEGNLRVFNRAVLKDGLRPTEAGTNPFFLIAQTVPLAINILAHRDCPIKPFGAVNTRNTFRFINPSAIRDWKTLVAASKLGQISYSAVFGGPGHPGRRRKRGVDFCITIDVRHGKETILKQDLWFLQSLPRFYKPIYQEAAADGVQLVAADVQQDRSKANGRALRISGRDPRRWAATSKDYNPIHVSAMGAKLFGFKSVIAHGNHVVALAVQQLVDAKTDEEKAAKARVWETDAAFEIEAKFLRPTTLPASLTADWSMQSGDQDAIALNVRGREKLNVTAVVRPTVTEKLS